MSISTPSRMYAQNHDQAVETLLATGHVVTHLIQGMMGTGKTSLLKTIGERTGYPTFYFDCTVKDLPDLALPDMQNSTDCLRMIDSEQLGKHIDGPVVVLIDELGKGSKQLSNGLMATMLERDGYHPDSIIFATSNLGAEGLGDMFLPHQLNRMTAWELRSPTAEQWIEWGINNGIDHNVLGWVKDTPQVMQDFRDVADPNDNEYINHPQAVGRTQVCTPRSLHKASDIVKFGAGKMCDNSLTGALVGTIGARGALDLMSHLKLSTQLPTLDSIKQDPTGAIVPTNASATCMVVFRTLMAADRDWANAWMTYMARLSKEAQALFVNQASQKSYKHRVMFAQNKQFTDWCLANNYMFGVDS